MATIRVPRWPRQEEMCVRQPRGVKPRGTLRGVPKGQPEIRRETLEAVLRRPRKGSQGTTDPKTNTCRDQRGKLDKLKKEVKRPTIITVEEKGHERTWDPLSKANAWKAGLFRLEIGRSVKVFLEKDDSPKEVEVYKRTERVREIVWLKEKNRKPQRAAQTR